MITTIIAIVALCFSGLALLIHWRNYRRDRPEIIVNFQWNTDRRHDKEGKLLESWGTVWVKNTGRRAIYIEMVAMKVPGRSYYENLLTDEQREGRRIGEGDPPLKARFYEKSILLENPDSWQDIRAIAIAATTEYISGQGVGGPAADLPPRWKPPQPHVIEVNRTFKD
jgi:hypothetical protein